MLDGTEIRFDDVATEMITVAEHLGPSGSCYTIHQDNNEIVLSKYCLEQLIRACNYFTND